MCFGPERRRTVNKKYPIWFNKDIIKNIKSKDKYRLLYINTYFDGHKNLFHFYTNLPKSLISEAHKSYLISVEHKIVSEPKNFWKFICNKKSATRIPTNTTYNDVKCKNSKDIIDSFAAFFESVYRPTSNFTDWVKYRQ